MIKLVCFYSSISVPCSSYCRDRYDHTVTVAKNKQTFFTLKKKFNSKTRCTCVQLKTIREEENFDYSNKFHSNIHKNESSLKEMMAKLTIAIFLLGIGLAITSSKIEFVIKIILQWILSL